MVMNLRRYDLNLLVVLNAVLAEGSVSLAAVRLNLTQAAVSQALERARDMFGDELMLRSGRGLAPTTRALALKAEIAEILGRIEDVIATPVFDPAQASRVFTIATSDLGELIVLADVLARLAQEAPGCQIEILPARHDYGNAIPDLLVMGAAPPAGGWLSRDLFEDRFVLIARPGHAALTGPLDAEGFARLPQAIVSPRGGGFSGPVDDALAAIGLARRVAVSLPRFGALPLVLGRSDLVAAAPRRFAELPFVRGICGMRELPFAMPRYTMRAVWHPTRDRDAAQIWLRERVSAPCAAP